MNLFWGSEATEVMYGGFGNDRLIAGGGGGSMDGGAGNDVLVGSNGRDTFNLSQGDDVVYGFNRFGDGDIISIEAFTFGKTVFDVIKDGKMSPLLTAKLML